MYAVIESGGKQYRVSPGDVIQVEKLDAPEGQTVDFNQVLMVSDDQGVRIGNPVLADATVTATIRSHGRGEKIRVVTAYDPDAGQKKDYLARRLRGE